jgi:hypothetical protein
MLNSSCFLKGLLGGEDNLISTDFNFDWIQCFTCRMEYFSKSVPGVLLLQDLKDGDAGEAVEVRSYQIWHTNISYVQGVFAQTSYLSLFCDFVC